MKAVVEFVAAHPYAFGAAGAYVAFVLVWMFFLTRRAPLIEDEDLDQ